MKIMVFLHGTTILVVRIIFGIDAFYVGEPPLDAHRLRFRIRP